MLELVAYTREQASSPDPDAGFELNLNTGEGVPELVETVPGAPYRQSLVRDRPGHPLARGGGDRRPAGGGVLQARPRGPPGLLAESVGWHRWYGERPDDSVLNACRALVRVRERHLALEGRGGRPRRRRGPGAECRSGRGARRARRRAAAPRPAGGRPLPRRRRDRSCGVSAPALPDGLEQDHRRGDRGVQRLDLARCRDRDQLVAGRRRPAGRSPLPSEPSTSTARPTQSTSV